MLQDNVRYFWSNGDLLFATEQSLDDNGEAVNDNDLDNGEGVNDLDDDGVFILYFFRIPSIFPPIDAVLTFSQKNN